MPLSIRPSLSSWHLFKRGLIRLYAASRWRRCAGRADDLSRPVKELSVPRLLPPSSSASCTCSQVLKDSAFDLLRLCSTAVAGRTMSLHRAVHVGPQQSLARTMPECQDVRPAKAKLIGYRTMGPLIRSGFHEIHEVEARSRAGSLFRTLLPGNEGLKRLLLAACLPARTRAARSRVRSWCRLRRRQSF